MHISLKSIYSWKVYSMRRQWGRIISEGNGIMLCYFHNFPLLLLFRKKKLSCLQNSYRKKFNCQKATRDVF